MALATLGSLATACFAPAMAATEVNPAAQASPSVTASADPTSPSTGGLGGGVKRGIIKTAPAPFGHSPIIDIVPIYTTPYPLGSSAVFQNPLINAGTGFDNFDVGGTFKEPLLPYLSASIDRNVEGTLNVPNARVTSAKDGKEDYSLPNFSRDDVIVYRLDETPLGGFQIEEGLYFRHRIAGGSNTSNNPYPTTTSSTEAHYGYAGVTYTTPRFLPLGSFLTFNINADTQAIDHHVGCGTAKSFSSQYYSPCVDGVWDPNPSQNRVFETDQYAQLTVPVSPKDGLSFSAQDRWGALNFYENAAFPYRWVSSQTYILSKRFNRVFTLSLRDKTQWAVAQGAPYIAPNAIHNGSFDILADFKADTNRLR